MMGDVGLTGTLIEGSIGLKHPIWQNVGRSGICAFPAPSEDKMSIEIEVLNGDASWPLAEPLLQCGLAARGRQDAALGRYRFRPCRMAGAGPERGGRRRLPCRHLPPRGHMERTQDAGRRHRRRADPRGQPAQGLCQRRAQCRHSNPEGRRLDRFRACCSANRTTRRSTWGAASSRSTARSGANSRKGAFASKPSRPMSTNSRRAPLRGTIDLCGLPW